MCLDPISQHCRSVCVKILVWRQGYSGPSLVPRSLLDCISQPWRPIWEWPGNEATWFLLYLWVHYQMETSLYWKISPFYSCWLYCYKCTVWVAVTKQQTSDTFYHTTLNCGDNDFSIQFSGSFREGGGGEDSPPLGDNCFMPPDLPAYAGLCPPSFS